MTVFTFLLLNFLEGIVYPQADILHPKIYDSAIYISRTVLGLIHAAGFLIFLVRGKDRLQSIIIAASLISYVWGFSMITGKLLTEEQLRNDYTFHSLLPKAVFCIFLGLIPTCYLIIWI